MVFDKFFTESRTWESDELMDIAEAIAETAKPRIPARVSITEVSVIRKVVTRTYFEEWWGFDYDVDYEVIEAYRLG